MACSPRWRLAWLDAAALDGGHLEFCWPGGARAVVRHPVPQCRLLLVAMLGIWPEAMVSSLWC